jgi:DNA processing protein
MTLPDTWLRLTVTPDIAPATARRIVDACGGPEHVATAGASRLTALGVSPAAARSLLDDESPQLTMAMEWLDGGQDRHFLAPDDKDFPRRLGELSDGPSGLFVQGCRDVLNDPMIAVVGSRNPSPSGLENAFEFSAYLSRCGLAVVSGLALGVDGRAHQGALEGGSPTIAVCGNGLDRVYPPQHRDLAAAIVEQGALVSEFPPGMPPRRENFPRRNRIISGLSLGVLVVEAGLRSGSLISARLAGEQGREVFAIPGSIHNPMAKGCHLLIKQGAKLVESAADILSELRSVIDLRAGADNAERDELEEATPQLSDDYAEFLELCGHDPFSVDQMVARTKLTSAEVSSMLLILELQGLVESGPGGRYTRASKGS